MPVIRYEANTGFDHLTRMPRHDLKTIERDFAGIRFAVASEGVQQLFLAMPLQTCDAQDLTVPQIEVDAAQACTRTQSEESTVVACGRCENSGH